MTVPSSGYRTTEATLSKPGSAPQHGVDSCVRGPETRSTIGMQDCLNAVG